MRTSSGIPATGPHSPLPPMMMLSVHMGISRRKQFPGVRDDGGRVGHDYVPQLQIQDVQDVATLGAGGAGTILKCRHKSLGKVAVKVPLTNNQASDWKRSVTCSYH